MKMQGVIVFFLPAKGYGYVRVPDTHEEFRFQAANLRKPVVAGDQVQFILREGRMGYYADEIELLLLA